jgi:peptidyl-tRNA hydrolase
MYTFLNSGINMSTGKCAAQAEHAAIEAYRLSDNKMIEDWYLGGHYMKVVLEAQDEQHLLVIKQYIEDRGFRTSIIIDEGRTEIRPHTATALGIQVVDKADPHVQATFESFKKFPATYGKVEKTPSEILCACPDEYLTRKARQTKVVVANLLGITPGQ